MTPTSLNEASLKLQITADLTGRSVEDLRTGLAGIVEDDLVPWDGA